MSRCAWSFAAPLALSVALFAGACKDSRNDSTLAQDTTLARDLSMANGDGAARPQLQDVPVASQPVSSPPAARPAPRRRPKPRPTPAPAPAASPAPEVTPSGNTVERTAPGSEPAVATVAAGTVISLTSDDRVCTNTHNAGDRFSATVSEAVIGSGGALIPAGAKAVVQLTEEKRSNNAGDAVRMAFSVLTVSWNGKTYPVSSEIMHADVEKVRSSTTKSDAKKVLGGAAIGAVLGQVIGKDTKGTVIGAAAGAAAGTAAAVATANYEGCVPAGGKIQFRLTTPTAVHAE